MRVGSSSCARDCGVVAREWHEPTEEHRFGSAPCSLDSHVPAALIWSPAAKGLASMHTLGVAGLRASLVWMLPEPVDLAWGSET